MACDIDTFKARFPEIDPAIVDAKFQFAIDEAPCYYEQSCLGDTCNETAMCMLVAHLITVDNTKNSAPFKDKASQAADGVSVTYVAGSADQSDYDLFFGSTKYGQRFLRLIAPCSQGAIFV